MNPFRQITMDEWESEGETSWKWSLISRIGQSNEDECDFISTEFIQFLTIKLAVTICWLSHVRDAFLTNQSEVEKKTRSVT